MTSDINNHLVSHCFPFTVALKGMEPAPNPHNGEAANRSSFKFELRQRQNMKGNDWTVQGKTKHTQNTDESRNLKKKQKKKTQSPTGCMSWFR